MATPTIRCWYIPSNTMKLLWTEQLPVRMFWRLNILIHYLLLIFALEMPNSILTLQIILILSQIRNSQFAQALTKFSTQAMVHQLTGKSDVALHWSIQTLGQLPIIHLPKAAPTW